MVAADQHWNLPQREPRVINTDQARLYGAAISGVK